MHRNIPNNDKFVIDFISEKKSDDDLKMAGGEGLMPIKMQTDYLF